MGRHVCPVCGRGAGLCVTQDKLYLDISFGNNLRCRKALRYQSKRLPGLPRGRDAGVVLSRHTAWAHLIPGAGLCMAWLQAAGRGLSSDADVQVRRTGALCKLCKLSRSKTQVSNQSAQQATWLCCKGNTVDPELPCRPLASHR